MPTDTERLDWYFGQNGFQVQLGLDRKSIWLAKVGGGYVKLTDGSGEFIWASAREAIDHAMELEKADA